MPQHRKRHLLTDLGKSLKFSPIVGVLGHRQVGKTTLCGDLAGDYETLDRSDALQLALDSPETLLQRSVSRAPLVIDECQLAPTLFPALKEWGRVHRGPGQFLLTGSVRFTSRKAIRESLTGRIIHWELLPMDLSESHSAPLPKVVPQLLKHDGAEQIYPRSRYFSEKTYESAMTSGGLPGIFAVRDPRIREQRFESQIETLLERDLRLVVETSLEYRSLRNLLGLLAVQQGLPLELALLSRSARISVPALKGILRAFEAMFIIRTIDTDGTRRRPVVFFEDQGEAHHLAGNRKDLLLKMTCFLFSFVRQQWAYRPELGARVFQYRSRGGAFVPLAIQTKSGTLGFIPMLDELPGKHEIASASSFLKQFSESKCVFLHEGKADRALSRTLRVLPLASLV